MASSIALLFPLIRPSHHARLASLAETSELSVSALSLGAGDTSETWVGVESSASWRNEFLPSADGVRRKLDEIAPDVIAVAGWSHPVPLAGASWAIDRGIPRIVMSESHLLDRPRIAYRERPKRAFLSYMHAAVVAGAPQRAYLEKLGFDSSRIVAGYTVVDTAYFSSNAEAARSGAESVRRQFQLPEHYIIVSSRLAPEKNLERLLHGYKRFVAREGDYTWDLVLVGEGPQKAELVALVEHLGLKEKVHFKGFQTYQNLPAFYALAECLVLASISEPWGMVVNEAMASGLPVIVSNRCGCAQDLVEPWINGFVFDPFDPTNLARYLGLLFRDATLRKKMSDASMNLAQYWAPARFSSAITDAIAVAEREYRPGSYLRNLAGSLVVRGSIGLQQMLRSG